MCGRYTLTRPGDALADLASETGVPPESLAPETAKDGDDPLDRPRYNVAPTHEVPVAKRSDEGALAVEPMQWGFSGHRERLLINARCETVTEKPSFAEAFEERRCLIPADGFFEWRRNGKDRLAYHFHLASREPFFFAGLWQPPPGPRGPLRCVILTTRANDVVAPVHDRMPVILPRGDRLRWLEDAAPDELGTLLVPLAGSMLDKTPVGPRVNKVSNDDPELIEPARHVENLTLF